MADAVKTHVLLNSGDTYVALFTSVSDGTGEAAVVKVDISGLTDVTGRVPTKLRIMRAEWCVQGFPYVKIAFDASADDTALVLNGVGKMCLGKKYGGIQDPLSSGTTGDIMFTAPAGASTGSYTILLHIEKD
jgi:hypothetical protein